MSQFRDESNEASNIMLQTSMAVLDTNVDAWGNDDSARKTNQVRFVPKVIIYHVQSCLNLRSEDGGALWYLPKEYQLFSEQCEASAKKIQSGIRLNPKKHIPHGLEAWTKAGFQKRSRNRKQSVHVVLDEQCAQWDDGVEDRDSIAELYKARCQHAEMCAVTRGLVLEREVQKLQAEAVLESPLLFSSLLLKSNKTSPYMEKIRSSIRSDSSSSIRFSNALRKIIPMSSVMLLPRDPSTTSVVESCSSPKMKNTPKSRIRDNSTSPRQSGKSKKQKGIVNS